MAGHAKACVHRHRSHGNARVGAAHTPGLGPPVGESPRVQRHTAVQAQHASGSREHVCARSGHLGMARWGLDTRWPRSSCSAEAVLGGACQPHPCTPAHPSLHVGCFQFPFHCWWQLLWPLQTAVLLGAFPAGEKGQPFPWPHGPAARPNRQWLSPGIAAGVPGPRWPCPTWPRRGTE